MDKPQYFLISLAILMFGTSAALDFFGTTRLAYYISFFILEYFVCSIVFLPRNRFFNYLTLIFFILWAIVAALNLI